jgi:L-rhamnose isomerase
MWNPFKPKTNTSVISSDVTKTQWRRNMWVMTPDGVGVLQEMRPDKYVSHLVDKDGLTLSSAEHYPQDVRQAKWMEIPAFRRQVSDDVAKHLGY